MKPLKLTNNFKHLVLYSIAFYLLVIALFSYLIILPTIRDIKAIGYDITNQKYEEEKKLIREQKVKKLNEKLAKIEPQTDLLTESFPGHEQMQQLELITMIEGLAAKNSITQKMDLSEPKKNAKKFYYESTINLQVTGTYQNVMRYLAALEVMKYYINIKNITINSDSLNQDDSGLAGQSGKVSAIITADTFWK